MRYLNKRAIAGLTAIGMMVGAAAAQQRPLGVPSVAPVGDATPPADLPAGAGPSGTSTTLTRFDQVGYVGAGGGTGVAVTGPSLPTGFAEITDLASGRTVLARTAPGSTRVAGRLADLSPAAAQALGIAQGGAVRVRQVDPIAADQVALDQGRAASSRLDAPPILLTGLRAQLAQLAAPGSPATTTAPAASAHPKAASTKSAPRPSRPAATDKKSDTVKPGTSYSAPGAARPAKPAPSAKPSPAPAKAAPPAKSAPKPAAAGRYNVRVGAFSNGPNAKALAAKLGGHATQSGKFWIVELGPFADAASAKSARDGAAKRGYGDARVIVN